MRMKVMRSAMGIEVLRLMSESLLMVKVMMMMDSCVHSAVVITIK